jgi:hypothetical protein
MSAFLAKKKVSIYSQGCVSNPWGGTSPGVYDIAISD